MITLRSLHAESFKGLRSVDLIFPAQGSILIEGQNEAGKSTLFEAVYVALYGQPLVGEEENRPRQEEVIQHGQPQASVELTFTVGGQELTVARTFKRGAQQTQTARLTIHRPGAEAETVNRPAAVNRRILDELGNLDGESLRNSCFVEQKELGRLEDMDSSKREQAIQKLLGLDHLTRLAEQFAFRRPQQQELEGAIRRRDLARTQAEARHTASQEHELAARLDAAEIVALLTERDQRAAEAAAIAKRLGERGGAEPALRDRLAHSAIVRDHIQACGAVEQQIERASAQRQAVASLARQLDMLGGTERVERPAAVARRDEVQRALELLARVERERAVLQAASATEQQAQRAVEELRRAELVMQQRAEASAQARARATEHMQAATTERERQSVLLADLAARSDRLHLALRAVSEWEAARDQYDALTRQREEVREQARRLTELRATHAAREQAATQAAAAADEGERQRQAAEERLRHAEGRVAIQEWLRLKDVEATLAGHTAEQARLAAHQQAALADHAAQVARARAPLVGALVATVLAALTLAAGLAWHPALALGGLLIVAALGLWVVYGRGRSASAAAAGSLAAVADQQRTLRARYEAAVQAQGDPSLLPQRERAIVAAGLAVPASREAARATLAQLDHRIDATPDGRSAQAEASAAAGWAARLAVEAERAAQEAEQSHTTLTAAEAANDPSLSHALDTRVEEQRTTLTAAEMAARDAVGADLAWPTDRSAVQAALAACAAEQRAAEQLSMNSATAAASVDREDAAALALAARHLAVADAERAALAAHDPTAALTRASATVAQVSAQVRAAEAEAQAVCAGLGLACERGVVEGERGRIEAQIEALDRALARRPQLLADHAREHAVLDDLESAAHDALEAIAQAARRFFGAGAAPEGLTDDTSTALSTLRQALDAALIELDEGGARAALERLVSEKATLAQQVQQAQDAVAVAERALAARLADRHLPPPQQYTRASLAAVWPLIGVVVAEERGDVRAALDDARNRLYAVRDRARHLTMGTPAAETLLDLAECEARVRQLEEEREVCARATRLIQEARDLVARQVLPTTERNMQLLLPELTAQRYWDVRLTPPEREDGAPGQLDYRIRVWDPMAGRYVAKNLFSGGTRDQCSLALRLAFALATLPQELGVAPGFIFLDEPLSAFDSQRARALVALLTTGTIAQQFPQVVVISHHHAFDAHAFQHHVRLESGRVVESDLPQPDGRAQRPVSSRVPSGIAVP